MPGIAHQVGSQFYVLVLTNAHLLMLFLFLLKGVAKLEARLVMDHWRQVGLQFQKARQVLAKLFGAGRIRIGQLGQIKKKDGNSARA